MKKFFLVILSLVILLLAFTQAQQTQAQAAWAPNVAYSVGTLVTYGGHTYKCLQAHTSLVGWEPPNAPALWQDMGPTGGAVPTNTSAPPTSVPPTIAPTTPPSTNLALNKAASSSGNCATTEGPEKAVNGSVSGGNADKWCGNAATKWMQVDLGASFNLTQFVVKHAGAGGESASWNTNAFNIQVSTNNSTWTTVVTVSGNTANITTHNIASTSVRYVRLNITNAGGDGVARIYEFEVYGSGGTLPTNTPVPTTSSGNGSPYGGTAVNLPGTVQVENYNTGGQGVAYNDAETTNQGGQYRTAEGVDIEATTDTGAGYNVGWTAAGEWEKYTVNVTTSGTYSLNFRVASAQAGGTFHLEVDGTNATGVLTVPNTGGWQTWTTVTKTGVNLSAGQHVMRLFMDAAGGNFNWFSVSSGSTPTNTPIPNPTATPNSTSFWGDTSSIPQASNVMMFKFLNRTNGKYPDSQIYWSFNGITHSIAEQQYFDMPANSAGRMNFYLGSPTSQYTDFIEFTIGPAQFNGNTTRVDWFGIKLAIRLHAADGFDQAVGEDATTFAEDRAVTFQKFIDEVPAEFKHLAQNWAPYRISAPGKMGDVDFTPTGIYANYFTSYAQSVGVNATVFDIMACANSLRDSAALCSALNRHVAHLAQSSWTNSSLFYQAAPANYYARFWHNHSIGGLAYGFPYDDYGNYSTYMSHANPQWMLVAIGW